VSSSPPQVPSPLRFVLPLVVLMTIFPTGFAALYGRTWAADRRGKELPQQRASVKGVLWFKPEFRALVKKLKENLPSGTGILVEPWGIDEDEGQPSGRTRWFLYLNYYAYPLRIFAHQPKLASGTLVDYSPWMDYQFNELNVDGGAQGMAAAIKGERLHKEVGEQLEQREIEWKLSYLISESFRRENLQLFHREQQFWRPVPMDDFAALAADLYRAEAAPGGSQP
jgi:hypothetical protein